VSEAVRQVEDEVRELIRRSGLDPTRHPLEVDRLVRDAVSDYDERSVHGGLPVLASLNDTVKSVLDVVAGYGPLQRYFDDPSIEEIWIDYSTVALSQVIGLAGDGGSALSPQSISMEGARTSMIVTGW